MIIKIPPHLYLFIFPAICLMLQVQVFADEKKDSEMISVIYTTETRERKGRAHATIDTHFSAALKTIYNVDNVINIQDACPDLNCTVAESEKTGAAAVISVLVVSEFEKVQKPLGTEGKDKYILQTETIVRYRIRGSLYKPGTEKPVAVSFRLSESDALRISVNEIVNELRPYFKDMKPSIIQKLIDDTEAVLTMRNINIFPMGRYGEMSDYGTGAAVSMGGNALTGTGFLPVSVEAGWYYHFSDKKNIDLMNSCYVMLTFCYGISLTESFSLYPGVGVGYSWHIIKKVEPADTNFFGHPRGAGVLALQYSLTESTMLHIGPGIGAFLEPGAMGWFFTADAGIIYRF